MNPGDVLVGYVVERTNPHINLRREYLSESVPGYWVTTEQRKATRYAPTPEGRLRAYQKALRITKNIGGQYPKVVRIIRRAR